MPCWTTSRSPRSSSSGTKGRFSLTSLGSPTSDTQTTLPAADDQSALDGDYENTAGNDLKVPFTAE